MSKVKYDFYSDGGHGWLKVPISELEKLQIHNQISSASYMRKGSSYLEEDCDAGIFIDAKQGTGENYEEKNHTQSDKCSKIRNYEPFSYLAYIEKIESRKIQDQFINARTREERLEILDESKKRIAEKTRGVVNV